MLVTNRIRIRDWNLTAEEKLLLRIKKNENDCWIVTDEGRNHLERLVVNHENRTYEAHRFVMKLINGDFDKKVTVCHKCDNNGCINPNHLYLGTHQTNADDRKIPTIEKLEILKNGGSLPWWT